MVQLTLHNVWADFPLFSSQSRGLINIVLCFIQADQQRLETMMSQVKILVLAFHNDHILRTFCNRAVRLPEGRVMYEGRKDVLGMHFGAEH
jgi:ABC-type phosphate/phosphonate transport system ATPase subunit